VRMLGCLGAGCACLPAVGFFFVWAGMCERHASSTFFSRDAGAISAIGASPNARLKSEKIRYILPKLGKESVDLPDFAKDSVAILQILLTF